MGRRYQTLDFPHTCPRIDRAISHAKSELESQIHDLLMEACPLLPHDSALRIASEQLDSFYSAVEDLFESVRATNDEMRRQADRQISDLAEELHILESRISELEALQ